MKKILSILCILSLLLALSACQKDKKNSSLPESSTPSDVSAPSGVSAPQTDGEKPNEEDEFYEADQEEDYNAPLPSEMVITSLKNYPVAEINVKWSKTATMNEPGEIQDFPNGDYALCTRHYYEAGEDFSKIYPLEIYRYDKDRNLKWKKTYKDLSDRIYSTAALSDGSLLILTQTDYTPQTYTDPETGEIVEIDFGTAHGQFTKISPNGDIVWSRKLTHKYEYFNNVFETPDGGLLTAGAYTTYDGDTGDKEEAAEPWDISDTDISQVPTLTRYDKDGNFLSYVMPKYGVYRNYIGAKDSGCTAQYKEGVGLLVAFSDCLVCYDDSLKEKWRYKYKDICMNLGGDAGTEPPESFYPFPEIALTDSGISIRAERISDKVLRSTHISNTGKLIREWLSSADSKQYLGLLPDGRSVYFENAATGNVRTRIFFEKNGKKTEFDSFETRIKPYSLTPTLDGGFFVLYNLEPEEEDYSAPCVATKYNEDGRTEVQRIFDHGFLIQPLNCGRLALQVQTSN